MYSYGENMFKLGNWFVSLHTVQMMMMMMMRDYLKKGWFTWMITNKENKYFQLFRTMGNESRAAAVKDNKPELTTSVPKRHYNCRCLGLTILSVSELFWLFIRICVLFFTSESHYFKNISALCSLKDWNKIQALKDNHNKTKIHWVTVVTVCSSVGIVFKTIQTRVPRKRCWRRFEACTLCTKIYIPSRKWWHHFGVLQTLVVLLFKECYKSCTFVIN